MNHSTEFNGNNLPLPPGFTREIGAQAPAGLPEVSHAETPSQVPEGSMGVNSLSAYAANKAAGSQNPGYGELAAERTEQLGDTLGTFTPDGRAPLHPAGSAKSTQTTEFAKEGGALQQTYLGSQQRAQQADRGFRQYP